MNANRGIPIDHAIVLAALADDTRRAAFELLIKRPMAVRELSDRLPVSRPAVSQHLKILKSAGLVAEKPSGTRRVYSVSPEGLAALRAYVERIWEDALGRFKVAADAEAKRSG